MIPAFMDDRTPSGERDVFNMLAAGPDEWVALHSLDLAPWNRGRRTEVDFVVFVPDTGIVCLEVKSHDEIAFVNDRWMPADIKRSPFKQAADGRFTFYRRLRDLAPRFKHVPVVHGCIFPNARFDISPNLSVQPWELIDSICFRSFSSSIAFCTHLRSGIVEAIEADDNLSMMRGRLTAQQVDDIASLCLPVQKRRPDKRDEIRRREDQLERTLREQQKPVLQLAKLNDRNVVFGGAGTGKTLIAMEVARRAAEDGQRVALLCFNRLVGEWMRQSMEQTGFPPNLVIGRATQVMAEIAGISVPRDPPAQFWEDELPALLEESLTDPDLKSMALFDCLVLDEAQDVLARTKLWNCLTQFLENGARRGRLVLFGDFQNQVLANEQEMTKNLEALHSASQFVRWELTENCRNYPIIGESAVRLSGFTNPVYTGFMRSGGSVDNYDISFYADDDEQSEQLAALLNDFKSKGFKSAEITVLSFRSASKSAASRLDSAQFNLRPAWQSGRHTCYTSVHSFKGLENKVIILTDVVLGSHDFQRHLFYTGLTRATEAVRILCDRTSQETLTAWLTTSNKS